MSRFSKYLLLFLLINIASGTHFPSFPLSQVVRMYRVHHSHGGLLLLQGAIWGDSSAPQHSMPASCPLQKGSARELSLQTGNAEAAFWHFTAAPKGFWMLCQSLGSGSAAGGWSSVPCPSCTPPTPPHAKATLTSNLVPSCCILDIITIFFKFHFKGSVEVVPSKLRFFMKLEFVTPEVWQ